MRHRYQASALIIMLLGISCLFQLATILAAPGDLDTTFAGTGKTRTGFGGGGDFGRAVAVQADGKLVVAGYSKNGSPTDFAVVRYNADGSLDDGGPSDTTPTDSFGNGGKVLTPIGTGNDQANAVALQADGKIVVAGFSSNSTSPSAFGDFAVVRYNTDGTLDTSFDTDGKVTTPIGTGNDQAFGLAIQTDGKLVVAGFSVIGSSSDFAVVRYNADGSPDTSFSGDGKLTTQIGSGDDVALAVALQADDKIVVAGYSIIGGGNNYDFAVVRYNTNGSLDTSFDTDGKVTTPIGTGVDQGTAVAVQSDGKIVVAGASTIGTTFDFAVVCYNANGTLDTSFDTDGKVTTPIGTSDDSGAALALQSDGEIVVAGTSFNGAHYDFAVVRYNANGTLDTSFDTDGKVTTPIGTSTDQAYGVALQSDGKMVVAGTSFNGAHYDFAVVRYNTNGALDTSLDGNVTTPIGTGSDSGAAVAMQADGKLIVGGTSFNGTDNDFAVVRYNPDGSLDTSFDTDGKVTTPVGTGNDVCNAVALQSDGKIVVAGYSTSGSNLDIAVVRYNADGLLDTTFDTDGKVITPIGSSNDLGFALAIQADGRVVVAGFSINGANFDFAVVRYNTNGTLDTSFDGDGKVITPIGTSNDLGFAVAIQANGKIVVAGNSSNGTDSDFAMVRYNSNGTLDLLFDGDGKVTTPIGTSNDSGAALALQSDGEIVIAGTSFNGTDNDFAVARYNPNGALDTSFDGDGKLTTPIGASDDQANAVAIQSDGKMVVAGSSFNGTNNDFAVVRYNPNGTLDLLFDGDGKVTTAIGAGNEFGQAVALQSDGKIVVAGYSNNGTNDDFAVARYNLDGTPDTSIGSDRAFDFDGKRTDDVGNNLAGAADVAIQSDGKIVVAGTSDNGTNDAFAVVRYNPDGTLDTTFSGDGKVTTPIGTGDESANAVAIQSDGKIVVAGSSYNGTNNDFAVVRYNTDGTLDTSFDTDGKVTTPIGTGNDQAFGLAIQTDGKLVVAGHSSFDFAVVRYNTDGSLDTSFDTDGKVTTPIGTSLDQAYGVALQSDSKIVVAGESFNGTNRDFAVARYNTDGTLDASFDGDGKVTTALNTGNDSGAAVAIQGDGRVVVAGTSNPGTNLSFDDFAVVRYNPDGSLDTSFDSDGKVSTPIGAGADRGRALAIQSDSKIVVAGNSNNGTNDDFAVVRYNSNGSLDTSYGTGGKVVVDLSNGSDSANGVALDSLGRAVVVGGADGLFGVVRLLGDTQPSCNYSLVPASDYVSARGGPCSFNVTVGAGCQWTAQTSESWMVIVSDPSGTGNGSVSLEIRDNFTSSARLGTVTVGSENFTVVQEGRGASCGYTVSPTFAAYQVGGGSGTLNITTSAACGWRAVSAQSWIEITSTEVGIGGATINYTVSTNTTGAVRDGAIVVGGQSLKVKQKGS